MNANMALTSLQSVIKYDFWGLPSKYLAMNALQVPVPSESQTPIKLLHAATNKTSIMAVMVKKISPSVASAAVTLEGTPCSSLERSLMNAAANPIMGREKTVWQMRRPKRKILRKTSSRACGSSRSLVLILSFMIVELVISSCSSIGFGQVDAWMFHYYRCRVDALSWV